MENKQKKGNKSTKKYLPTISWISEWENVGRASDESRYTAMRKRIQSALRVEKLDDVVRYRRIRATANMGVVSQVIAERIRKSNIVIVDLSTKENENLWKAGKSNIGDEFRKSLNANVVWEFGMSYAFLLERKSRLERNAGAEKETRNVDADVPRVRSIYVLFRQEQKEHSCCGKPDLHRQLPTDFLGFYLNTYKIGSKKVKDKTKTKEVEVSMNFDDTRSFSAMLREDIREAKREMDSLSKL